LLPADAYARFLRREGEEVLFICATDEHGAPAEIAAREAGMDVQTYCDLQHGIQRRIYERFGIAFDFFGRSSSPENQELTQLIFQQLETHGWIDERVVEQTYSRIDARFLADRYIVGMCPHCGYTAARGDQCEHCTRLLVPSDLICPRSAISGADDLELRTTRELVLRLSAMSDIVSEWVTKHQATWPPLTRQIAWKWLDEGLRDRSITRDLSWGIRVPRVGFEDKVFYVWFDAPIAYIATTRQWAVSRGTPGEWESWWVDAGDVEYTQFMGKDNVPFHTVMFPAMLLGASRQWTTATTIKSVHWLDYYGGKFSTSRRRGVFTDQALELYPADYWRYFLLTQMPETADTSFTWELFADTINKDLAGMFGNFVNRVLRWCVSQFGAVVPHGGMSGGREERLYSDCADTISRFRVSMRSLELRRATRDLRGLWSLANHYIQECAPWRLVRSDPDAAAMVIRTCLDLVRILAITCDIIMPTTARTVMNALHLTPIEREVPLSHVLDHPLPEGRIFDVIEPLIGKITTDDVVRLRRQFDPPQIL